MIKENLYKKSVDILFNAYFNDTLSHGICTSCAIGNLIAANNGYKIIFDHETSEIILPGCTYKQTLKIFRWQNDAGVTVANGMDANWYKVFANGLVNNLLDYEGRKEIYSTGYSVYEAMKIEYAFENADKGDCAEDWMFNGLVSVLGILKEIHEVEDNNELSRFEKHYESLLSNGIK